MRFVIEKNNCFVGIVDVFIVNLQVEGYERVLGNFPMPWNQYHKRPYRKLTVPIEI